MKKILLLAILIASLSFSNQTNAQCNGANIAISNFRVNPTQTSVNYSFNWEYLQGNASIQVQILCNNVLIFSEPCLPRLKDSTAGVHLYSGARTGINCNGVLKVQVVVWTSPDCGGTNCVAISRDFSLSSLPVSFKSFTAARTKSNVLVNWETSSEINNSGFAVERNTNGNWEQVAFVNSLAQGGNSNNDLSYQYIDLNNAKGISQYRIKQVDIDSKSKYSEIRSVKGDGQNGQVIVYPNPTTDGRINVVFDNAAVVRNIAIIDMSGRTVKQINGISNNNISIDNLMPGMYSLRIFVPETGEQMVQKIVVNKR